MADAEVATGRLDKLRIIRTNVGPVTYFQLIARFGSPAAALRALPNLAGRGGGKVLRIPDVREMAGDVVIVKFGGTR
jgi:DNA processing protein